MMKKILVLLFTLFSFLGNAQIIDVLQGHIGTAIFPPTESINFQTGKPDNIYGAFAPAQTLGVGGTKFITDKIQVNGTIEIMNTFKDHYNLFSQKTSLNLKYNFIAPDIYRFSPYLIGGGNYSYLILDQSGFVREYVPPGDYDGENYVDIEQITYRESDYTFFGPAYGWNIGAGLDVNVFEVVSVFGEFSYNTIYTTRSSLQNNITSYNKSDMTYTSLNFGVRLYLY